MNRNWQKIWFEYFFLLLLASASHEQESANRLLHSFTLSICGLSLGWCAHLFCVLRSFWILRTHDYHVQHCQPLLFLQFADDRTYPLFLQPSVDRHWPFVGRFIKNHFSEEYSANDIDSIWNFERVSLKRIYLCYLCLCIQ